MRKPLSLICAALLAAACHGGGRIAEPSPAGPAGRVVVRVFDESWSPFPGAVVTLARVDAGSMRHEVTDVRGMAVFHDPVAPGDCRILVEAPGYSRAVESITLEAAGPAGMREIGMKLKPRREFLLLGKTPSPARR